MNPIDGSTRPAAGSLAPLSQTSLAGKPSIQRSTPASRITGLVALAVVVALSLAPWWAGRANLRLFGEFYTFLALAGLWNLLGGFAGLVSVGQQAFVGFGGYVLFALAILAGASPLLSIVAAGVLGVIVAVPMAKLLFRLQGAYFTIGTWVAAEVFRLGFSQFASLGGGSGTSLPAGIVTGVASSREMREWLIYWIALALVTLTFAFIVLLLRSRTGLALTAIRDSEVASESLGVDIQRIKLAVYAAVAGLTSMAGALIFLQKLRISPEAAFSVNDWTAYVIFMVVIGGIGSIEGPLVGALVFFALRETLANLGSFYLLVLGAIAIAAMLKTPRGLWGYFEQRFGVSLVPVRRRVVT